MFGTLSSEKDKIFKSHKKSASHGFLQWCGVQNAHEEESSSRPYQKAQKQKTSIRQVLRKSSIFQTPNLKTSQSQYITLAQTHRPIEQPPTQRVNFSYNGVGSNAVHNYHTTNYIVGRYIVQPNQYSVFVNNKNPMSQSFQRNQEPERRDIYNRQPKSNYETQPHSKHSPPYPPQIHVKTPIPSNRTSNKSSIIMNQHSEQPHLKQSYQSTLFSGKILTADDLYNNKEYHEYQTDKKQDCQNMLADQNQRKVMDEGNGDGQPQQIKREVYKRGNLFSKVRRTQTMNEDPQDSESDNRSQVIQDYKSLMSKIQENRLQDSDQDEE